MMKFLTFLIGTCALSASATAGPGTYTLTEVSPNPLLLWVAYDLGPQGQVVGRAYNLNVSPPLSRGWVWHKGSMTILDGPAGETITEARCIDAGGIIYGGYADHRFPLQQLRMHPVRWVGGAAVPYANNVSINSATIFGCSPTTGAAVGWAKPFEPDAPGWQGEFGYASELPFGSGDPVRAFKWSGDTGSVLARSIGAGGDLAVAINDSGQAALTLGTFELGGAAMFDPRFGIARLPGLGAGEPGTRTFSINQSGRIVGFAQGPGGTERPVVWDRGAITDLGLLPGFLEGQARDINDAGVIVGGLSNQVSPFGVRPTAGFVRINGTMHNLNALIPAGTGFVVHEALAVNNAGQILAAMNPPPSNDPARFAVLTPAP